MTKKTKKLDTVQQNIRNARKTIASVRAALRPLKKEFDRLAKILDDQEGAEYARTFMKMERIERVFIAIEDVADGVPKGDSPLF